MMAIPDRNETIYQVIYSSITKMSNMKVLKEFGFYNYFIIPGENNGNSILFLILYFNYSTQYYNGIFCERF